MRAREIKKGDESVGGVYSVVRKKVLRAAPLAAQQERKDIICGV